MHPAIGEKGHLTLSDQFTHLLQQVHLLFPIVLGPVGMIHKPAPKVDIVDDKPGNGSHVAVPGPDRLVRVTVLAGPLKNGADFGSHCEVGLNRSQWIDGRIGLFRPQELDEYKKSGNSNGKPILYLYVVSSKTAQLFPGSS